MESVPPLYRPSPGFAPDDAFGDALVSPARAGDHAVLRWIDWIWRIRGRLPLPPGLSADQAFDRLAPLFGEDGTRHQRSGDTLVFTKTNQAAQDKMSVFDGGALRIDRDGGASTLRYQLTSRALLACFVAPLFFLGMSGVTLLIKHYDKPAPAAAKPADKKAAPPPMNPIDKFLGAPAPDKPKTGKDAKKGEDDKEKKLSPKAGYVFAEIFAGLYVIGRILEDRQVRALFRMRLTAEP